MKSEKLDKSRQYCIDLYEKVAISCIGAESVEGLFGNNSFRHDVSSLCGSLSKYRAGINIKNILLPKVKIGSVLSSEICPYEIAKFNFIAPSDLVCRINMLGYCMLRLRRQLHGYLVGGENRIDVYKNVYNEIMAIRSLVNASSLDSLTVDYISKLLKSIEFILEPQDAREQVALITVSSLYIITSLLILFSISVSFLPMELLWFPPILFVLGTACATKMLRNELYLYLKRETIYIYDWIIGMLSGGMAVFIHIILKIQDKMSTFAICFNPSKSRCLADGAYVYDRDSLWYLSDYVSEVDAVSMILTSFLLMFNVFMILGILRKDRCIISDWLDFGKG